MFDTDVFVIGGGPAGLATAIAAARRGLRVLMADGCRPPVDKGCGEGLLPDSLAAAAALGVTLSVGEAHPFVGIRFVRGAAEAKAKFRGSTLSSPLSCALGVRRTILHRVLTEHAERAGVELLWETSVAGISGSHVLLHSDHRGPSSRISAKWIVGADGERSRVRTWARLEESSRNRVRFGFRRHYGIAPWTEFLEVHWVPGAQVYVTPLASDEVCIAALARDPHMRLDDVLRLLPELRERLAHAPARSAERGAATATRRLRAVYRGNVALVGDASGSVDAVTGQGIGVAFQEAYALAQALSRENLSEYQATHTRLLRHPSWMAELLLAMDRWPWAGTRAMRAFHRSPGLFGGLLDAHVGQARTLAEIGTHARLGWHILFG